MPRIEQREKENWNHEKSLVLGNVEMADLFTESAFQLLNRKEWPLLP